MKSPTASAIFLVFLMLGALIAAGGSATAQCRPSANDSGQSSSTHDAKKGLDDFNRAFIEACRSMNHDAAGQLWADDGVDLLPGMEPMVGKAEISSWLKGLGEKMKGV